MPARQLVALLVTSLAATASLEAQLTAAGNQLWDQSDLGSLVEAGDRFGAVLVSGDFDGDTYDDLAIGLPGEGVGAVAGAGGVLIVYGSPNGLNGSGALPVLSLHQDVTGVGDAADPGDGFGSALAVGDFDSDGHDDLAVGVPNESEGSIVAGGIVQVFYGSLTGIVPTGSQMFYQESFSGGGTTQSGDRFGAALAACRLFGFGGNAYAALLVGIPEDNFDDLNNAGALQTILGSETGLTTADSAYQGALSPFAPAPGDQLGAAVACGVVGTSGTTTAFAVGAPFADPGGVNNGGYAVHGASNSGSSGLVGSEPNSHLGSAVAVVGRPGFASYGALIGSPDRPAGEALGAGAIHWTAASQTLIQGAAGLADQAEEGDRLGTAFASGDFNADGVLDFAFGVPEEDLDGGTPNSIADAGIVHVLFGHAGSATLPTGGQQLWSWQVPALGFGPLAVDRFGAALAAGDFDGDGVDDLAIGAPGALVSGQAETGLVQILYGERKLLFAHDFELGTTSGWSPGAP